MTRLSLKEISLAGLIAAVYAVLGLAFLPISFGVYQVRVAEALTVLPFLTRAGVPGLFIGCVLANIFGGLGWQDIVFGSLITLVAALLTRSIYHLSRTSLSLALSFLPVVLLWAGGITVLNAEWLHVDSLITALLAMVLVVCGGMLERRSRSAAMAVSLLSLVAITTAVYLARIGTDLRTILIGCAALAAAWFMTSWVMRIWRRGGNPNEVLAPLPPVVLNAFGVALYLAPLIQVDYWFAVQMVGVGQLIACYLLGLPLLRLLGKRPGLFG